MKPVLKYPGSKNRIASWICGFIPPHEVYLEVYFGGGSIFFEKEPARIETINDLSSEVYNFFKVLREHSEEFIRSIELTPYGRDEYEKSFEHTDNEIENARRFAVRCFQGFGASNRYKNGFRSGISKNSPFPAKNWNELPQTLREAAIRLKEAQIENQDALKLLERYNKKEVFVYADPPYLLGTRKGYLYKHEMTDDQHKILLETLLKFKGKVMISGYENKLYDTMLKKWEKQKIKTLAENSIKREEVIWMNYKQSKQIDMFNCEGGVI